MGVWGVWALLLLPLQAAAQAQGTRGPWQWGRAAGGGWAALTVRPPLPSLLREQDRLRSHGEHGAQWAPGGHLRARGPAGHLGILVHPLCL